VFDLPKPTLSPFCTLEVDVGPAVTIGPGRFGQRRVVPILGGRVSGPKIAGHIHKGGADWQTVSVDGLAELDARYVFETDDGAIIEIINSGFRHGPETAPYMRTVATLETGHPDYAWINRMMFIGTGAKVGTTVRIELYAVE